MTNRKSSYYSICLTLFCALLLSGALTVFAQQEQTASNALSPIVSSRANRDYRIGPGDVLIVTVAGELDLKGTKVKVSQQGTIELLYIDHSVKVAGLTEQQVTELLKKEFIVILKEPQVTIFIEEYHAQMVSIAGAVNKPKQVALNREMRVYDLISDAGGLTDKAGNVIQLVRFYPAESMEIIAINDLIRKPELNRVLRDGDMINVPEAGIIYVTGNGVNKPGAFPLKEPIKLTAAIALAGGLSEDAKKKEVHLIRSNGPDQAAATESVINFSDIEKDASKDIVLKPYDVVMVPESTRGKQTRTLIQAFAGGLSSALGWGVFR
jgi:polysaccharide export outer membrane protein